MHDGEPTSGREAAPLPPPRAAGRAVPLAWLTLALLLSAANLRSAVTSVGPLLGEMQRALDMTDTVAGVLTSLPVISFGVMGLLSGRLARRLGAETTLGLGLVLLASGLALRALAPGVAWLMATSLLALSGIAIANVVVPVLVRSWFPSAVGSMTGWYAVAIAAGSAIPAAAAVPLAEALGSWRVGLGIWALPVLVAWTPWLAIRRRRRRPAPPERAPASPLPQDARARAQAAAPRSSDPAPPARQAIHRQAKTWGLALFFGLQSLEAYTMMGWYPSILRDGGVEPARAGLYLGVVMGLGAPISLLLPRLAARSPDQRPWVVGLFAVALVAYLGLMAAPGTAPLLWSILMGIGFGAFPLSLVLIGLKASTARGTTALSSLAQGVGYLVAAGGPLAFGALHDLTGAWTGPLALLTLLLLPKLAGGLLAASPGQVD